jgi:hypothetical protein
VGVLKFRVQIGDGPTRDNAGTINRDAADGLELALALANPREADRQLLLVRDASSVAATIRGASHVKAAGIPPLFSKTYPAAWGEQRVAVDAFLTGVIQVAADLRTMKVAILAVQQRDPQVDLLTQFMVPMDGTLLNKIGASFQRRGLGDPDDPDTAKLARQVRDDPSNHFPLRNGPVVSLKIFYDRQPVPLRFVDGGAVIPEPREGQKVILELERLDRQPRALGAVLKVNGENTLFRERQPDFYCGKWVLSAGRPITISGFQLPENRIESFRVAGRSESAALEMDYGPDVGTISLVVFQEATSPPPPRLDEPFNPLDDDALDLLAIAKAEFPAEPPRNSEALKATLRATAGGSVQRGIITSGKKSDHEIQILRYQWDSDPLMSVVIRYYRPGEP